MISALILFANSIAKVDFPTAVGPKIAMNLGIVVLSGKVTTNT